MFAKRYAAAVIVFAEALLSRMAVAHPLTAAVIPTDAGPILPPSASLWLVLTALGIALALGALSALELRRRTTDTLRRARPGSLLVNASQTLRVFAPGAIVLYVARYRVPEHLYLWLSPLCGLILIASAGSMLLRRLTGTGAVHTHTGGMVPSPAAFAVLLSAFALHRFPLGLLLIAAYCLGLIAILIAFGIVRTQAGRPQSRSRNNRQTLERWLPVLSATLILLLGCAVACQSLAEGNLHLASSFKGLAQTRLGPLLYVIGLGLILGMRHSTDADHVVAISTIVSKQRSIRGAALIGSVWGIGHTITIFIVGSLIILFGVAIPPRLGLSMEFCVALMLVLLGLLNLTGILGKVTERFTPKHLPLAPAADTAPDGVARSGHLLHQTIGRFGAFHFLRPLVIGLVHGLAGSAAVALLVLSTIHNPIWATFYLLVFGAGTMVGMMCMTAAMAVPFTYAGERFATMSRYLNYASGVASLCFGSFLVYQLGYVGNLFGSHPLWTPQ